MLAATDSVTWCIGHRRPLRNLQNFCFPAVPLFLRGLQSDQSERTKASSSVRSMIKITSSVLTHLSLILKKKKKKKVLLWCCVWGSTNAKSCFLLDKYEIFIFSIFKYLSGSGSEGTFVLWFWACPFARGLSLVSNFPVGGCGFAGLPEECVPGRTGPAVRELRGQGNSRLSCQKKHKQTGLRESSCFSRPDSVSDADVFGDACSFSFFPLSFGKYYIDIVSLLCVQRRLTRYLRIPGKKI